ncbi:hypothetical protein CSUI_007824, partial [Cystoisospora suis]
ARSADYDSAKKSSHDFSLRPGDRESEWGLHCRVLPTPRHLQKTLKRSSSARVAGRLQEVQTGSQSYSGALNQELPVTAVSPQQGEQPAFQQTSATCRKSYAPASSHPADGVVDQRAESHFGGVSERQPRSALSNGEPARDGRLLPRCVEMGGSPEEWNVRGAYESFPKGR